MIANNYNKKDVLIALRHLARTAFHVDRSRTSSMLKRMVEPGYSEADFMMDFAWMRLVSNTRYDLSSKAIDFIIEGFDRDPKTTLALCVFAIIDGDSIALMEVIQSRELTKTNAASA